MKKKAFVFFVSAAVVMAVTPALAQETVRVHLATTNDNVVLEARGEGGWIVMCTGTCDRNLPKDAIYRINGEGIQPSKKFALSSGDETQWLDVQTGSAGAHTFGLVTLIMGISGMPIALSLLLTGAVTYACSNCVAGYADTTMLNVGWTIAGVSVLAMIVGGVMTASTRTIVTTTTDPLATDWRSARALREKNLADALPPIVGVPIFGASF